MYKQDIFLEKSNGKKIREKLFRVCEKNNVVFLALFGSFLRGDQTKKSDIDFVIKFDKSKKKSLLDLIHTENEFKRILKRKVDLLTPESISPYLRDTILKSMRVIYERR